MKRYTIILLISFFGYFVNAQTENRVKEFNLINKIAIQGYDPVAYFNGKALKGNIKISTVYQGAVYHFSSTANKELFLKNPAHFEPQYGGWCAYAMGISGDKVEINPETFKIVDGKLNLFYNAYFNNTMKSWNKDEPNLKKKADVNWNKIIK